MKLKWLKDKLGEKFYPIAHATGVVVAENKTLDSKLSEIDTEIGNKANKAEMMDIKMLGWSVPKECPVQNEVNGNQFVQKVGRVDLSSLSYTYEPENMQFYSGILSSLPQEDKWNYNLYCNKYPTGSISGDSFIASYGGRIYIRDKNYTNGSTLVAGLKNTYLYYELATPITITIDGYEIGETVSDVRKETTVNLFKPTLESTTVNGIVVTNNGDGTYTFNGTATAIAEIKLGSITLNPGIYKNLGATAYIQTLDGVVKKVIHDEEFIITTEAPVVIPLQWYDPGDIATNAIKKPMITTNLNATIDDFVPYTGSTGSLNKDVAELRGDVDGFGDEFVTRRIQLLNNRTADYYRYIEPIPGRDQILTPPIIVNGTSTSFDSSGSEDQISGNNYSYAHKNSVKMDILDAEISSSITQAGVTVKYIDKKIDDYKYYDVRGTATSDIEIPLYSVTNPKNDYLYFITNSVSKMSSDTFYIKISDASGKETTLGFDDSKKVNTHLKPGGKVTVCLVVKSGIKVNRYVNVKCGYSSSDCIADFSPRKYSDTIDNVIDAILDLNNRLKVLENK